MLTLYHLRISHFSEKARWGLESKGLDYRSVALVPGLHILRVRRVGGGSTVPVLVDSESGATLTDSTDILHYLDRLRRQPALFPEDPDEGARVAELEEFFDEHCARHLSGYLYHFLLDHPRVLARRWSEGLGPLQRPLARMAARLLPSVMRRKRNINARTAAEHRRCFMAALDRVERELDRSGGEYLVGGRFSAADLAGACLIGPAVQPPGSPWRVPDADHPADTGFPPREVVEFLAEVQQRPAAEWVATVWARHRRPQPAG